ncbi:hypothetical protein [Pandoraea faecigallinarum]|nr:hypothetical protein [Pandoraea faecigallinarum]
MSLEQFEAAGCSQRVNDNCKGKAVIWQASFQKIDDGDLVLQAASIDHIRVKIPDGFDTGPLVPGTMVKFSGYVKDGGDDWTVKFDNPQIVAYESHIGTGRRLVATRAYWVGRCMAALNRKFGDSYVLSNDDDVRLFSNYQPFGADVEVHMAYEGRPIPGIPTFSCHFSRNGDVDLYYNSRASKNHPTSFPAPKQTAEKSRGLPEATMDFDARHALLPGAAERGIGAGAQPDLDAAIAMAGAEAAAKESQAIIDRINARNAAAAAAAAATAEAQTSAAQVAPATSAGDAPAASGSVRRLPAEEAARRLRVVSMVENGVQKLRLVGATNQTISTDVYQAQIAPQRLEVVAVYEMPHGTAAITAECADASRCAVPKYRIVWQGTQSNSTLVTPPFGIGNPKSAGIEGDDVVMRFTNGFASAKDGGHLHVDDTLDMPRPPQAAQTGTPAATAPNQQPAKAPEL